VDNPDDSFPAPGVEIESVAEFDAAAAAGTLAGHRIQSVDLTDRSDALLAADTSGAVFLGCRLTPEAVAKVRAEGAFVFPPVPGLPFDPYSRPGRTATPSPRCCARSTTTRSPTRWTNSSPGPGWSG
jgi:hypothetical protein